MDQEANNCLHRKESWFKIQIVGPSHYSGDLNADADFKYSTLILILFFLRLSCFYVHLFFL